MGKYIFLSFSLFLSLIGYSYQLSGVSGESFFTYPYWLRYHLLPPFLAISVFYLIVLLVSKYFLKIRQITLFLLTIGYLLSWFFGAYFIADILSVDFGSTWQRMDIIAELMVGQNIFIYFTLIHVLIATMIFRFEKKSYT